MWVWGPLRLTLVAQCSATPATVAATPPCSATPFQTQISVRHLPGQGGGKCDTKIFRGCSATPVLHLQNATKSRKSAATRVARHVQRDTGYPQSCATKRLTILMLSFLGKAVRATTELLPKLPVMFQRAQIPMVRNALTCYRDPRWPDPGLALKKKSLPPPPLVAPYCAIPRDYLSDTPLLRAMGFLASQYGQLGAIPPPPFSERFPLGKHAKWRCDTPPSKGVSQRYLRDTL